MTIEQHLLEIQKYILDIINNSSDELDTVMVHIDKVREGVLELAILNNHLLDTIDSLEEQLWDIENEIGADDFGTSN